MPNTSIVLKILAADPRGKITEEDKKGKRYQTMKYMTVDAQLNFHVLQCYKDHPCVQVGRTITILNPCHRYNKICINNSSQVGKGFISKEITQEKVTAASFRIEQPINPFISLKEANDCEADTTTSVTGMIFDIGDRRTWTAEKAKYSQDVRIRQGNDEFTVTLWDQCTAHPITVGDHMSVHDGKIKVNLYGEKTIWCSQNDQLWLTHVTSDDWDTYHIRGYDDENVVEPRTVKLFMDRGDIVIPAITSFEVLMENFNFTEDAREIFFLELYGKEVRAIITGSNIIKIEKLRTVQPKKQQNNGNDTKMDGEGLKRKLEEADNAEGENSGKKTKSGTDN